MKNKIKEKLYSISAIVIILDQLIKIVITRNIKLNQDIEIIPNFFNLTYLKNTGAAFSILENSTFLLIMISLVFLYFLVKYIEKETTFTKLSIMSYGLIIGGIIGNLVDRLVHNYVIDYLSFNFGSYYFPVFNLADSCIVIGIIILIISVIKEEQESKKIPVKEQLESKVEVIKKEETSSKKKTTTKKQTIKTKSKTSKKKVIKNEKK